MKHINIKFLFIGLLIFISCSNHSPKTVAGKFLTAFSQKKFDEAKKYCTPETVKLVEMAESLSGLSTAKTDFTGKKYEVVSQEVKGQKAFVRFKENGTEELQTIVLKYSDNQWMVSIAKEDIMSKQNLDKNFKVATDTIPANEK